MIKSMRLFLNSNEFPLYSNFKAIILFPRIMTMIILVYLNLNKKINITSVVIDSLESITIDNSNK